MEVHHHTHHPKKWKEYFWEFFMLFLAVLCGFLAEYQLEHKIENDRAKELAISLYSELIEDSIRLDKSMELRNEKAKCCKYLMQYFKDADMSKPSDSAFKSITFAYLMVNNKLFFEPSEGILFQLQNSGSRRYFKKQQLQDAISNLASSINFVKLRNERELSFMTDLGRPFCIQHFDYFWLNEYLEDGKLNVIDAYFINESATTLSPQLKKWQTLDRESAVNIAGQLLLMQRGMSNITIPEYRKSVSALLQLLRKEFPGSISKKPQ